MDARIEIRPRETVVLADDYDAMIAWYRDVLGFRVVADHREEYHFANLETDTGIRVGIGDAKQMGVAPIDRRQNTVVLQFEVDDVAAFFAHLEEHGGSTTFGPSRDEKGGFSYGGFADPEGNPYWVVDRNCP